jgi:hypothetical protein
LWPSRQKRICSAGARSRFACATTSAISRTGSFTPVDECTHVSANNRVVGDAIEEGVEALRREDVVVDLGQPPVRLDERLGAPVLPRLVRLLDPG